MNDLISIITPAHNTGKFISATIQSVLHQTYPNWEMLIVDDDSTDDTAQLVASFHDSRLVYIKNERNSGAAYSRNKALRMAKGRWIAFLDSDDLWHPQKLERQLAFMENGGFEFSYTCYSEIDEENRPLGKTVFGPKIITKQKMLDYCWPGCLTVMYDAKALGLIQIADLKKNNDYAMWLQLSKKADCHLLQENLALYRKRLGSLTAHGKLSLIRYHYLMFRQSENMPAVTSALLTARNLFFGFFKKLYYVRGDTLTAENYAEFFYE